MRTVQNIGNKKERDREKGKKKEERKSEMLSTFGST
jgi:hypothetical protein